MPDAPERPDRPDVPFGYPRGPRRRPPWWPEDEPFPPRDGWGWGRRRFVRRMAMMLALFLLFLFITSGILGAILWHAFGGPSGTTHHPTGAPFFAAVFGV